MKFIGRIAIGFAIFLCIITVLPFIRTDEWWVRIFDFPRLQILFLGLIALAVLVARRMYRSTPQKILIGALSLAMLFQCVRIFPYTPIAAEQVRMAEDQQGMIRILIANVLQDNRRYEDLQRQIGMVDPDVILLTETDTWWTGAMSGLEASHPHFVLHPQDNTYGMNLYSRFPLKGEEVRFLIDDAVPSIRTRIQLENGREVLFHGLHPRPPGTIDPDKDELQDSDQRDAELVVVAKEVRELTIPVIVAGDFNDVAWSHTTRLFQRTGRLLDPRVGRGMFNTYHADLFFFRYPLDHLFHSDHFTLIAIRKLDHFGSDHFPMYVALNLEPGAEHEQEGQPEKRRDDEEAKEMLDRVEEK
jgi:endonuclease/exonuclease/phosphatase (EEP) superfamily protein YafD